MQVAIIRSAFYDDLVTQMQQEAITALTEGGVPASDIQTITVPGSFEIPLACKKIFTESKPDGIIALGIIIQGETHHAAEIARACTDGLMQVQLTYQKPIVHAVLFVDSLEQATARAVGKRSKGREAGKVLLQVLPTVGR
jgi:6,7-dimethyl-8-ribityllumazine synthase